MERLEQRICQLIISRSFVVELRTVCEGNDPGWCSLKFSAVSSLQLSVHLFSHIAKMHSFSNGCCACCKWATLYILNGLFSSTELCWCKSTLARASSESAGSDRHVLANSGQCVEICLPGYKNKCTKACPRLHGSDVLSSEAWRC